MKALVASDGRRGDLLAILAAFTAGVATKSNSYFDRACAVEDAAEFMGRFKPRRSGK